VSRAEGTRFGIVIEGIVSCALLLSGNFSDNISGNICETEIPSGMSIGQFLMIEPGEVQNGSVPIDAPHFPIDGGHITAVVGDAMGGAGKALRGSR
jgi:hypothetical protein